MKWEKFTEDNVPTGGRGSGRTTKMLRKVLEHYSAGKLGVETYIVAPKIVYAERLARKFWEMAKDEGLEPFAVPAHKHKVMIGNSRFIFTIPKYVPERLDMIPYPLVFEDHTVKEQTGGRDE